MCSVCTLIDRDVQSNLFHLRNADSKCQIVSFCATNYPIRTHSSCLVRTWAWFWQVCRINSWQFYPGPKIFYTNVACATCDKFHICKCIAVIWYQGMVNGGPRKTFFCGHLFRLICLSLYFQYCCCAKIWSLLRYLTSHLTNQNQKHVPAELGKNKNIFSQLMFYKHFFF